MSAVVLPAASAAFTSTQVIFSNSTRSACARGAARADPAASIREAVPPAINISKECETEPMRMSFSFPQKHKLVAVLTENRQFYKFIIIMIIVPSAHDSVTRRENALGVPVRSPSSSSSCRNPADLHLLNGFL